MTTDYRAALLYLFRQEPGSAADYAVERIYAATIEDVKAHIKSLADEGAIEPHEDGWRTVPEPDPAVALRDALQAVVQETDPEKMTEIAQQALADTP